MTDQVTTNAVREARRSVVALLGHLPEAVWREHKGAIENAVAQLVGEALDARLTERARICAYLRSPGPQQYDTVWAADRLERGET